MIVVKGEYITRIVHLEVKVIIEKMVPTSTCGFAHFLREWGYSTTQ